MLRKAQKAVLNVIAHKAMTVADTVDKASKNQNVKANEIEGAVYMMLHRGEIQLDRHYRLKRVGKSAK